MRDIIRHHTTPREGLPPIFHFNGWTIEEKGLEILITHDELGHFYGKPVVDANVELLIVQMTYYIQELSRELRILSEIIYSESRE